MPEFDWQIFSQGDTWISLATLSALEIVLGIDNIVFIAILVERLPKDRQGFTRKLGISLALLCHHAESLIDAGIVLKRKEGPTSYWSINREALAFAVRQLGG